MFNSREAIAAITGDIVFFLIRCLHRWFLRPVFLESTFPMTSVTSTDLQLKFVAKLSVCI